MRFYLAAICFCLALILRPLSAAPADTFHSADTFHLAGAVGLPRTWSVDQIKKELPTEIQTVSYTLKGTAHTAHAVPLWAVLQAANPKINPQIKRHLLQFVAAVSGRDGYTVDFTLGEVSPDFGANAVWIALDQDGKPLAEEAGPVELLVPGDKRGARWVHGVSAITLTDMAQVSSPVQVRK